MEFKVALIVLLKENLFKKHYLRRQRFLEEVSTAGINWY